MKHFFVTIVILFTLSQVAYAQPKPQDSDTLWTKWVAGEINKVQFTPDGNSIAVGGGNLVRIYDIQTGNLLKTFTGYGIVNIMDFIFSPDGKKLITSNATSTSFNMIVWDYDKIDSIVSYNNSLVFMKFINNEQIFGATGRGFHIVDSNGKTIKEDSTNGDIYAFAVSPTNDYFAVGAEQDYDPKFYNVELWDLNTFKYIMRLGTHNTTFADFVFSPDGKYLATSSRDGFIKIWDMNTKTLIKTFVHDSTNNGFLKIIYSPTNNYFVSSGGGGNQFTTKICNSKDFNLIYTYGTPYGASDGLDISKDTSLIAIGNAAMITLLKSHWTPTKVEELPAQPKIIYPNPSGNEITIPLNSMIKVNTINITNSNGIIVKKIDSIIPYIKEIKININILTIGFYFILVTTDTQMISYKFEKVR
jgi:WD40 repeat protein